MNGKLLTIIFIFLAGINMRSAAAAEDNSIPYKTIATCSGCILGGAAATLVIQNIMLPLFRGKNVAQAAAQLSTLVEKYAKEFTMPETFEELQRLHADVTDAIVILGKLLPSLEKADLSVKLRGKELANKLEIDKQKIGAEIAHHHASEQLLALKNRHSEPLVIPANQRDLTQIKEELVRDSTTLDDLLAVFKTGNTNTLATAQELHKKIAHDTEAVVREETSRYQASTLSALYSKYKEELDLLNKNKLTDAELARVAEEHFGQNREIMLQSYLNTLNDSIQHAQNAGIQDADLKPFANLNKLATRIFSAPLAAEKEAYFQRQQQLKAQQLNAEREKLLFEADLNHKRTVTRSVEELTDALAEARNGIEVEREIVAENGKQLAATNTALNGQINYLTNIGVEQRQTLNAQIENVKHFTGQAQMVLGQLLQKLNGAQELGQQYAMQILEGLTRLIGDIKNIKEQNEATQKTVAALDESIQVLKNKTHVVAEKVGVILPDANPANNAPEPSAPPLDA